MMFQGNPVGSEEFFERLNHRAFRLGIKAAGDNAGRTVGFQMGINATIEALKERMVGEPKRMFRISHHTKPDGEEWTFVRHFSSEHISLDGHHGTDGEEVVVGVFKW